jgi:hypothetical protein
MMMKKLLIALTGVACLLTQITASWGTATRITPRFSISWSWSACAAVICVNRQATPAIRQRKFLLSVSGTLVAEVYLKNLLFHTNVTGNETRILTMAVRRVALLLTALWHQKGAKHQTGSPLSLFKDSVSAFDSYASANSLINLLANALLHEILDSGRPRIHDIATLYRA